MYVVFANDLLIYDFLSNKIKILQPPDGVHLESLWSQVESLWSPGGVQP